MTGTTAKFQASSRTSQSMPLHAVLDLRILLVRNPVHAIQGGTP